MTCKLAIRRILVAVALLAAVLLSSSSTAQIQSNGECVQAKTWHLQQAMKSSLAKAQDYHLGAAQAADELSTMGGQPCVGWQSWAKGDTGYTVPA